MTREDEEEKTSSLDAAESSSPTSFGGLCCLLNRTVVKYLSGVVKSKIAPLVPVTTVLASRPPQRKKFGSDKEFIELMKQRMKFEDEMEDVRREVYLAFGGILTALFEDAPQIFVNAYRVVTGCGKTEDMTCGSAVSGGLYTWSKADTWMFFFSLKTVGIFCLKLSLFHSIVAKRRRLFELKELIKDKTEECKANRTMNAQIVDRRSGRSALEGEASAGQHGPTTVDDNGASDFYNRKMIAQITELKRSEDELLKKIRGLEMQQGDEGDEQRFMHFREVTMLSVPDPTSDEIKKRDEMLSHCYESNLKFEKVSGAEKSYPTVEMFASKHNTFHELWAKCIGEIDEEPGIVFPWLWHFDSNERMAMHREDQGDLLRVSDMPLKSRNQVYRVELKLGPGVHNRRAITKYTWFNLESSGREGFCMIWEPCTSLNDPVEDGFTARSTEAKSKGIYLFEKIAPGKTKFTMVQTS